MSKDYDEYIAWQKSQDSMWHNFKKNISPVAIFIFVGIILFGMYIVAITPTNKLWVFLVIGVIAIILILRMNKPTEKKPIPENIAKILVREFLSKKIGVEYPIGTIVSSALYCRMMYEGEWGTPFRAFKWGLWFEIIYTTGKKEMVLVLLQPYEGYITGIIPQPAGYDEKELRDMKVLLPLSMTMKEEPKK